VAIGLTIDELVALNDEVAALVRSGVPLERGLVALGADERGRKGATARALADRLERGESLVEAIAAEPGRFPALYRSLVAAGMRAGRLPAALEGLATYARHHAELRRAIGQALGYPLLILAIAYAMFIGFLVVVEPQLQATFDVLRFDGTPALAMLGAMARTIPYWVAIPPALLTALAIGWMLGDRATSLGRGGGGGLVAWVPGVGGLLRLARRSMFADLLAELIDHRVPIDAAVSLAAEASGDPALIAAAGPFAASIRDGRSLDEAIGPGTGLPPLLRWLLGAGAHAGAIAPALRQAGRQYRERALKRAELLRIVLPVAMTILVGAVATLLYTLSLFVPMVQLLWKLTIPA